jgi:REP element-mobilizing transposase RayT
MSTYRQILYQIIFCTKDRTPALVERCRPELYKYIWGVIDDHQCKLYRIGGIEDHIHILSDLHPSICLADFVKDIKLASSSWIKNTGWFPLFSGWQTGYGAFTYNVREKDVVIDYIKGQKEHHQKESFLAEYKRLLIENGILFEEKYLL